MNTAVARLFDDMAGDYDRLEPWYVHLYARLHAILRAELAPPAGVTAPRALDAGCGHGAQTALLAELGYDAHGVDVSAGLLAVARRRVHDAALARADVEALPYADASFDAVSCLGSTLSFVDDADRALAEIARVLRPGGRLLVECEHKASLDLVWMLASALTGDALGYGVSAQTLRRALRGPWRAAIAMPYPGYGCITLFSGADLRARLAAVGLGWTRAWGVHAVTNVLPSTLLHRDRLPRGTATFYRALCAVDARVAGTRAGRALANSLVVLATKKDGASLVR